MNRWAILEQEVIDSLKTNGYSCTPDPQFKGWYYSNCPIQFGGSLWMQGDRYLFSQGTRLTFETEEEHAKTLDRLIEESERE